MTIRSISISSRVPASCVIVFRVLAVGCLWLCDCPAFIGLFPSTGISSKSMWSPPPPKTDEWKTCGWLHHEPVATRLCVPSQTKQVYRGSSPLIGLRRRMLKGACSYWACCPLCVGWSVVQLPRGLQCRSCFCGRRRHWSLPAGLY